MRRSFSVFARLRVVLAVAVFAGAALVAPRAEADAPASSAPAAPASFSCSLANLTAVERRICASPSLSALDAKLSSMTMRAFDNSYSALELNGREAAWLNGVRDACADDDCLAAAYSAQINAMSATLDATLARDAREAKGVAANDRDTNADLPVPAGLRAEMQAAAGASCLRFVRDVDLGDGAKSVLAFECKPGMLSTQTYLFHPDDRGSYALVFSGSTGYLRGFELQDERSHGLRRLRIQEHASCCDHPVEFLDYDGSKYACVADADEGFDPSNRMTFTISRCYSGV